MPGSTCCDTPAWSGAFSLRFARGAGCPAGEGNAGDSTPILISSIMAGVIGLWPRPDRLMAAGGDRCCPSYASGSPRLQREAGHSLLWPAIALSVLCQAVRLAVNRAKPMNHISIHAGFLQ